MTFGRTRLAGVALLIGGVLTISGYAAANIFAGSSGDARFTNPLFVPLYSIALAGDLITVVGLPVILAVHRQRAYWLTNVGFVGVLLAMVMLNIGEGVVEAFVKPYLVEHGGVPSVPPTGFDVYENAALALLLVGLLSLGIAVIRARVFPWWAGALLIVSIPLSFIELPGSLAELGDCAAFLSFAVMGWVVASDKLGQRGDQMTTESAAA